MANPRWLAAYLTARQWARKRHSALRSNPQAVFSVAAYPKLLRTPQAAVADLIGVDAAAYIQAVESSWLPTLEAGDQSDWSSRTVLLDILAAVTRLSPPRIALEVGVERGYSSAVILAAMSESGLGRLLSIDLPRLGEDEQGFVGRVIPDRLRDRWELTLGPSQHVLPEILANTEPVNLFLHDGDHSYDSQLDDLRITWPRLAGGAIVVVDDVWSPAIVDFAVEVGVQPLIVRRADDHDAIGMLRRP